MLPRNVASGSFDQGPPSESLMKRAPGEEVVQAYIAVILCG